MALVQKESIYIKYLNADILLSVFLFLLPSPRKCSEGVSIVYIQKISVFLGIQKLNLLIGATGGSSVSLR